MKHECGGVEVGREGRERMKGGFTHLPPLHPLLTCLPPPFSPPYFKENAKGRENTGRKEEKTNLF